MPKIITFKSCPLNLPGMRAVQIWESTGSSMSDGFVWTYVPISHSGILPNPHNDDHSDGDISWS